MLLAAYPQRTSRWHDGGLHDLSNRECNAYENKHSGKRTQAWLDGQLILKSDNLT
jgi:hypothetical protein